MINLFTVYSEKQNIYFYYSDINVYLEENVQNGWLLGDSGYPLKPFLMTSVINEQTPAEIRYDMDVLIDLFCYTL